MHLVRLQEDEQISTPSIRASKDRSVVRWSDLLDFYISLDKERSKETVFQVQHPPCSGAPPCAQPLHHDGDYKAAQHSRRETIVKIIPVSTGTSYVFIITRWRRPSPAVPDSSSPVSTDTWAYMTTNCGSSGGTRST